MFYLDVGEVVRFRVETEEWHDQIPNAPDLGEELPTDRKPAYSIFVRYPSSSGVYSYGPPA
jgi:DNA-directed RNA polymerase III subunit RPC8